MAELTQQDILNIGLQYNTIENRRNRQLGQKKHMYLKG